MILQPEKLLDSTARTVACRCDSCGVEKDINKYKLIRKGEYLRCQRCAVGHASKMRAGIPVSAAARKRISEANKNKTANSYTFLSEDCKQQSSRSYIETTCTVCKVIQYRRSDTVKNWRGMCKRCSAKEVASRPEMKEILRRNGQQNPPPRQNVNPDNLRRGPLNNRWKGGITPLHVKLRNTAEARGWRRNVFTRDNYTCQICGKRGGDMEADHIYPFSLFADLRYVVDNGRTCCKPCHQKWGAKVSGAILVRASSSPTNWLIG